MERENRREQHYRPVSLAPVESRAARLQKNNPPHDRCTSVTMFTFSRSTSASSSATTAAMGRSCFRVSIFAS